MADRFVSPCLPPEGLTRELLTVFGEEGAEVMELIGHLQVAVSRSQIRTSKAMRFGVEEVQPGQPHANGYRIGQEVGDFLEVLDRLIAAGVIPQEAIDAGRANKRRQLAKFLQSAPVASQAEGA